MISKNEGLKTINTSEDIAQEKILWQPDESSILLAEEVFIKT